ncbi:tetratricopeptide repeat protein [Burkholderia sp. SIMBA_062]|uniref:tetratricopeptide repeat protein n=1 Tax=Burkholderia sp. SIMBA_062 TaxID=3085803 RepID=UPI00397C7D52
MTSNGEGTTLASAPAAPRSPDRRPPDAAQLERLLARARNAHRDGALEHAERAYGELLALEPDHPEALHLLGAVRFQQGRLDDAEPLMRRSVERQPVPLALANYSAVLAGLGREHDALARLDEALAINPAHQRALFQRAGLLAQLARYDEACAVYDRLLELTSGFADGYVKRSDMLRALGRHDDALADCDRAIAIAGRTFDAMRGRGLALRELGRFRDAVDSYGHALAQTPGSAEVLFLRGVAYLDLHDPERALADFNAAIAASPTFVDAIFNSSVALEQLERHDEALVRCDRVLAIDPRHARALANRGNAASRLERYRDAVDSYARALDAEPGSAGVLCNYASALMRIERHDEARDMCDRALALDASYAPAWFTRGRVQLETHRYDAALDDFARVIAATPRDKLAHFHRGNALRALRRHDDARQAYADAIDIDPDYVLAHCMRAFLCLSIGDFEAGWAEYEWRWRDTQLDASRRTFAQPRWTHGMPLDGKTILLYPEQGLGDTLQFCRYVPLVKALGARVVLEAPVELKTLFATLDGVDTLVARGEPLPPFDLHCPLLSLPLEFRTDLTSIPASVPYLAADPARVAGWRDRLGASTRPRIGLVWSGNPLHLNDRNRSMTLADLLPLFDDRYEWISLQKVVRDEDRPLLDASAVRFVGDELADFADTAALTALMDGIVSVDTSVAHLAGALGRPLALMIPHTPDFRWLLERDDSLWYPSARLFRQPEGGQWAPVVERIAAELPALVGEGAR